MWKIFQQEFYKIASKKVVWIGLFLVMTFITYRLWTENNVYAVTIDGRQIYGLEAIQKDKELTARYAGPLTEEILQEIYEKYGFFYYDPETRERRGNFCSQFITERTTNFNQIPIDSPTPKDIHFYEGQDWEHNVEGLLEKAPYFDYAYGWADLQETYGILTVTCIAVLLILGLAPVFSEEYSLKTADILLTTPRGKGSGIWMKAAAALSFSLAVYVGSTLYVWGLYLNTFGTQGLNASPLLIGAGSFGSGYCPSTIGGFFLFQFALGLAGIVLLVCMALAASALCKNTFLSVVVSLGVFLLPVVWLKVFAAMGVFSIPLRKALTHFSVSMPIYLLVNWGFDFRQRDLLVHLLIAAAVGAASIVLGYRKYKGYQR